MRPERGKNDAQVGSCLNLAGRPVAPSLREAGAVDLADGINAGSTCQFGTCTMPYRCPLSLFERLAVGSQMHFDTPVPSSCLLLLARRSGLLRGRSGNGTVPLRSLIGIYRW